MEIFKKDIRFIKGVGHRKSQILKKMNILTIEDMCCHFPRDYEVRSPQKKINQVRPGDKAVLSAEVSSCCRSTVINSKLTVVRFTIQDDTGSMEAVFFNQKYIVQKIKKGQKLIFCGNIREGKKGAEIINPSIEFPESFQQNGIIPIYSISEGISQNQIISIQKSVINAVCNDIEEHIPELILKKNKLMPIKHALKNVHFPNSIQELQKARYRLIFDELLLLQLGLIKIKKSLLNGKKGIPLIKNERIEQLIDNLPFSLTAAQKKIWKEVTEDLEKTIPMNRLLQGDVGSGKTIIALLSLYKCFINGFQGALMVPTEILAEQHYDVLKYILEPLSVKVGFLAGSMNRKKKDNLLNQIREGKIDILIGTHALIQEDVLFNNLALVITDEQHRFGVRQRAALVNKGKNPHILVMTATPIPRTLALILYGDLDISVIDELPPGRIKIKTCCMPMSKKQKGYEFAKKQLILGKQIYVVCPLVEESEEIKAQSAVILAEQLKADFFKEYRVELLHGKMNGREKEDIMRKFKNNEINVLVSTTVIEVGINVPNATVMVVENAERFGLAQLHQLRGRVGRGDSESYCILLHNSTTKTAKERMNIMEKTTDGFLISEKDLELRGPGEFFGLRQHGLPELKIANLFKHMAILKRVQLQAEEILQKDPCLDLDKYPLLKSKIEEKFYLLNEPLMYS